MRMVNNMLSESHGMIGLVLVTHGRLAEEFRSALEHIVGEQEQIRTVCMGPEDNIDERRNDIVTAIDAVDTGSGAILLTDMFGGTPSNLAISVMQPGRVEVIAGINLPMLVKLASVRVGHTMEKALVEAQDSGRKYIHVASHVLAAE